MSQFETKKSIFELASNRYSEKQIIIFDMFLSKIKIFLKIAFFSVGIYCCAAPDLFSGGHSFLLLQDYK
jgi:hypothetical protein